MVEAASRALRFIVSNVERIQFADENFVNFYTLLSTHIQDALDPTRLRIVEQVVSIIACICKSPSIQAQVYKSGVYTILISLMEFKYSWFPKVQEAALEALANLVFENKVVAESILSSYPTLIQHILGLVVEKRSLFRFFACSFLIHIYKCGVSVSGGGVALLKEKFSVVVLPALVKLFSIPSNAIAPPHPQLTTSPSTSLTPMGIPAIEIDFIKEKAPIVFAYLVGDSEALQKAALDANAIHHTALLLKSVMLPTNSLLSSTSNSTDSKGGAGGKPLLSGIHAAPPSGKTSTSMGGSIPSGSTREITLGSIKNASFIQRSALLAISASCSLKEECRKAVMDQGLLPLIVTSLSDPSVGVREAACKCARSLSRSVKNLRTSLMDAGIAQPILHLLNDTNIQVQISASAPNFQ